MEKVEQQPAVTGAQPHETSEPLSEHAPVSDNPSMGEDVFLCTFRNHWVPRNQAAKKGENPSICRTCAAAKREQNRQKAALEEAEKRATVNEIPVPEERGATKRATYTLHQYAVTATEVLAVGTTPSEVVERAIIHYLQQKDPQIISFVNRMFAQATKK